MTDGRRTIALVTPYWADERSVTDATRLIAGALALHGDVDVLHLDPRAEAVAATDDSVFRVHVIPVRHASPEAAVIAATALAESGPGEPPGAVTALLDRFAGDAPDVADVLAAVDPDVVVLAGHAQPYDLGALGSRHVVLAPMLDDAPVIASPRLARLVRRADALLAVHPGEREVLAHRFRRPDATPLDLALPLNRSATAHGLFGVGWFGEYAVVLREFPDRAGRFAASVTRDVLSGALGGLAVAEVDGARWRISNATDTAELPVNPTRVNLWRLMANSRMTVDLRPADPVGWEALESMLLGVPVVVPDRSAAMAHVAAADGGLWYRDLGEAVDCARVLMDRSVASALGAQGLAYAEAHHQDMDGFVERLGALLTPGARVAG